MGDIFTHAELIDCPECPGVGKRNRKPTLEMQSRNYSGSGIDIGVCPECGKSWAIRYKVKNMERAPDWDIQSAEQRDAEIKKSEELAKIAEEDNERIEYARLHVKYGKA